MGLGKHNSVKCLYNTPSSLILSLYPKMNPSLSAFFHFHTSTPSRPINFCMWFLHFFSLILPKVLIWVVLGRVTYVMRWYDSIQDKLGIIICNETESSVNYVGQSRFIRFDKQSLYTYKIFQKIKHTVLLNLIKFY